MAIGDDFTIDYDNKKVIHTSGSTIYSVNALYSWLMDTFDEISQMDDEVPISAQTPTEYTWINSWFMDDTSYEYLDGGALATLGWNHPTYSQGVRVATFEGTGYTNAQASDLGSGVSGATSDDTGTLLAYDNTIRKWWIRPDAAGDTWDPAETIHVVGSVRGGTGATGANSGENLYANIYTLGSIQSDPSMYIVQDEEKLTSWWGTGHIDVLVKVKEAGTEITGAVVTIFDREWTDLYDHFEIDLSPGGRNAVPIATQNDLNNTVSSATAADYDDITIDFTQYHSKDLNNGAGARNYDVSIDCATRPVDEMYEYLKYVTRRGSTASMTGTDGEQYITADPSYALVKQSPFGTFAGGKFFGARGVWIENYDTDDAQNFQLIDASGDTQTPPNTVSIKVTSVTGGDRVSMFRLSGAGGDIWKDRYGASGQQAKDATGVDISGAIATDEPQAGWVRIVDDSYKYDSWAGSRFSLSASLATTYATASQVYVPIIDTMQATANNTASNSLIYSEDVPVRIRVRQKGIIPFEIDSSIISTGLILAAIRTTDTIVT